jgi:sulfite reductase (NADPH) hemoprotein beta-component
MRVMADLAERYSADELRITHIQNVVLPHVKLDEVHAIWSALVEAGLETANAGLITDIIACPGMDYCKLATARSIPIAQEISKRFADADREALIGKLGIKISGCINACGHHHVGHIGLLGVEKKGAELYQITLGGSGDEHTSIGEIIGRGFAPEKVTDAIETIVNTYLDLRLDHSEIFLAAYRRVGPQPFKEALYGSTSTAEAAWGNDDDEDLERDRFCRKRSLDRRDG